MSRTDFQDGGCGGHRGFPIDMILAHSHSAVVLSLQSKFQFKVWEEMLKSVFQHDGCGGHLGFLIDSVLAILCLLVAPVLLIKILFGFFLLLLLFFQENKACLFM